MSGEEIDTSRAAVERLLLRRTVSHGERELAKAACHCVGCDTDRMLVALLARVEKLAQSGN